MKIAYLGAGTWGFALAALLASKEHRVTLWTGRPEFARLLAKERQHPKLPRGIISDSLHFTSDFREALDGADCLIESVTSTGLRPILERVVKEGGGDLPLVITSKGIERGTGLLLPEVAVDVLGKNRAAQVGCLSGPSHAEEVMKQLPTSVVSTAYDKSWMLEICELFTTPFFRVYPNGDVSGVSFGGAMKNIIAIACGISDGLGFGDNTKAALMTRGLHEIRKLASTKGCNPETLSGLSGMGDLCVTCLSRLSRNYMFGFHVAEGLTPLQARDKIGMVVEGMYTCVAALELAKKYGIPAPITEGVYAIVYKELSPLSAVETLLQRAIKEEHL